MPESGQHLFFYSEQAIRMIARKYEYNYAISGGFVFFVKPSSGATMKLLLVRLLLKNQARRVMRALISLLPARGAWKDHLEQRANN